MNASFINCHTYITHIPVTLNEVLGIAVLSFQGVNSVLVIDIIGISTLYFIAFNFPF